MIVIADGLSTGYAIVNVGVILLVIWMAGGLVRDAIAERRERRHNGGREE